jgi:triosephosphate isomerase (TIM)
MTHPATRRPVVAGNWKMHGSRLENTRLIDALVEGLEAPRAEVLVCPPFTYLAELARVAREGGLAIGGQDVCAEAQGAFTGEVSAAMLRDVGCTHVIVGHSERRAIYREDDGLVARKFMAAQAQGLVPILCVGETLDERERGATEEVITRQLEAVLAVAGVQAFAAAIVAYEPVWAIGTGKTASPAQAQDVHALLRARIVAKDANIGGQLRILYGGSVKASNAHELFAMPDVDGGLVGGASLQADEFLKVIAAA